jgi:hypothetical protein
VNIKIDNDPDAIKDDGYPDPDRTGQILRGYAPPTGSVPGSPVFESNV